MPQPSTSATPHLPSYRRITTSSKLRENRPQSGIIGPPVRRRRSRSPEVHTTEEFGPPNTRTDLKKRRPASLIANHNHSTILARTQQSLPTPEEQVGDRGRKGKSRYRPSSQVSEEVDTYGLEDAQNRHNLRLKKAESSPSPFAHYKPSTPEISDAEDGRSSSGRHAVSDYARMNRELEALRKQVHQAEKKMGKQSKEIDKLRKELSTSQRSNSEHCQFIEKLRTQTKKTDEVISNIEGHMNCHICMDLLMKPCGLSPCGHVLCQTCLQEWFRSAPASDDEMFDDGNPDALLYRKKICPVCRTVVRARPIPLFVLKNIADLLEKAKGSNHQISPVPEIDSVDPWAGIFFELASEPSDSEEDDSDDDDDEDEDEDDEDEEEGDYDDDQWSDEGYGTPDDGEPYEGPYVRPHWSPPTVNVSPDDFPTFVRHLSPTDLSMLSRGATLQMIMLFRMSYSHQDGLRAIVDGSNVVYLGWNVELVPEDENGEEFMEWVTKDMHERPERWEKEEAPDGTWTARKLVPAEDDEDEEEYYTSDSDVWAAELAAESGYSLF